jgi:uncharacterized phiE125 gp8 family phage protein
MMGAGVLAAVTLAEAQAYVRIETGEEEAIVAGLVRSASALCEAFIGQVVVAREVVEELRVEGAWVRLGAVPVRSIGAVAMVAVDGTAAVPGLGDYAVDIDAQGGGWVRLTSGAGRVRVTYVAGLASDRNAVPEPLRQGIVRLVGHLFAQRDGSGGEPPAAVTALWRPYRRMRLS